MQRPSHVMQDQQLILHGVGFFLLFFTSDDNWSGSLLDEKAKLLLTLRPENPGVVALKTSVAILFGGQSSEHEVSLQSARNVINAIDRGTYELTLIGVDKQGRWLHFDESDYLLNGSDPSKIKLSTSGRVLSLIPGATADRKSVV